MAISDTFLNELKMRNPVEEVIGAYVDLKGGARSNVVKACCPFHNEKTPSFMVYKNTQSYYCFGCNKGGDVITFVMEKENLGYIEAVRLLAERAGMQMPERDVDDSQAKLKMRILAANREAARYFHNQLKSEAGTQARQYLLSRGLLPATIVRFGLGYAPDSWDSLINHLKGLGFTMAEMSAAALVSQRSSGKGYYDKFRGRVMFPIIDLRGNVIAFGGRTMLPDGKPKYINTDVTPVYQKSRHLYALNIAKNSKADEMIVCEGYMDVIAMHQAGFDNAVAGLGTAIGAEQARLLAGYVNRVVLAYDGDEAGQIATRRAIDIMQPAGLDVRVLKIPVDVAKDPDEFIKKRGREAFEKLLAQSLGSVEFELNKLKQKYNLNAPEDKVNFTKEATALLAKLPTPGEREVYAGVLSDMLSISRSAIVLQIEEARRKNWRAQKKKMSGDLLRSMSSPDKVNPEAGRHRGAAVAEEMLLAAMIRRPEEVAYISAKLGQNAFITPWGQRVFDMIVAQNRDGVAASLTTLSAQLSEEEISKLGGILAKSMEISIRRDDIDYYIDKLQDERKKQGRTDLSESDLLAKMQELKSKKK